MRLLNIEIGCEFEDMSIEQNLVHDVGFFVEARLREEK